jgi:uncharacterized protein YcfJ
MRKSIVVAVAAVLALQPLAMPTLAVAKDNGYGSSDPCNEAKHKSADKGTATGAVVGALAGAAIAGQGDRAKGAVVGGALGAVAGHQIGLHNYKCATYPKRVSARSGCHWIVEDGRSFEICRGRDGVWRPSGRA